MLPYRPITSPLVKPHLGQGLPSVAPPPGPDPIFTGYTGFPGIVETIAVLGITGAAAWVGISTGLDKTERDTRKIAGWVGGIGSALLGVLYLAGKSGLNQVASLPAVRVTPV